MRGLVLPSSRIALVLLCGVCLAGRANATSYRHYEDWEIVYNAEVLVEGVVIKISSPKDAEKLERDAYSVATVKVIKVFKGNVKAGDSLLLVFWSHVKKGTHDLGLEGFNPLKLDERLMLPLNRAERRYWHENPLLSPEIDKAEWVAFHHPVYNERIQSKRLRAVAEVWSDPSRYLKDKERRGDAIRFLAVQGKLSEEQLLALLTSKDKQDQLFGCEAAYEMKTRAALATLIDLALSSDAKAEQENRPPLWKNVGDLARAALAELPIDGRKDGPLLIRLALDGQLERIGDEFLLRLLHAGPARAQVTAAIVRRLAEHPDDLSRSLLIRLDARAAHHKDGRRELPMDEPLNPKFAQLAKRLESVEQWHVYEVKNGQNRILAAPKCAELSRLLIRHADARARGLKADAEAAWLVDLYDPPNSRLPTGQLWVAEDGTFGFSWLPERAWGKSPAIAALLKAED